MFLFHISNYDNPALNAEVEELLRQRLEVHSRQRLPGIWKVTDRLNTRASDRQRQEKSRWHLLYSIFLLAFGIFILVPGLVKPGMPVLIWVGGLSVFVGILGLCPVHKQKTSKTPKLPVSCRMEAKALLEGRQAHDWTKTPVEVSFDETGMAACAGEEQKIVPYGKMAGIFETENLWLLTYDGEKAMLLQKKDLSAGDANVFSPFILQKICENTCNEKRNSL